MRCRGAVVLNHEGHKGHEGHEGLGAHVERVCKAIVDSGLKVHRALGPGLLESAYEHCLAYELSSRGLSLARQVPLPIVYEAMRLEAAYRMDIVVGDAVVVEIKAVEALTRLHEAQVLTYLKLSGKRVGFLMNFNVELFKDGLRRLRF
ncbi:MAG TPA: GxxExxY protein [Caulobacteraceae bacterium]|nr:GxxExxY protein [Caulobacteraceae bacterium]